MIAKPQVTIDHTPSKFGGFTRGNREQKLIVNHITAGTNSLSWLRDPTSNSPSVNYLIKQSGEIVEIVDPHGEAAWTNGINYAEFPFGKHPNMKNPIIAELTRRQISPNQWSVTIEHEGLDGTKMTQEQWGATTELQAWLCAEFNITPDATHIIGHFEIDGIDRPNCPGWTPEEWIKLRQDIKAKLDAAPPNGARKLSPEGLRAYINPQGQTIVEINFGGQAVGVIGVNAVDIGAAVENGSGEIYDRSVQANQLQPWRRRP